MRRRLSQVALALATLALCGLAIDRIIYWSFPLGRVIYRPDPVMLYKYVPGASKFFIHAAENGGDWVRVNINEQGYRGEALRAPGEAPRILVYGDSFVAAEFSPLGETYVAQLARDLEALRGGTVETINAGLVGAGPDQVARRMPFELEVLAPDGVVVVITSANDFGDLVRNKLYRVGPAGELIEYSPALGPGLRHGLEPGPLSYSGWGRLFRAALRGFPLRARELGLGSGPPPPAPGVEVILAQNWREYRNAVLDRDPVVRNLFSDGYDADLSLDPGSPSAQFKRDLMKAVLGEIGQIAERARVPLLVVVVPSPVDIREDHFSLSVDPLRFPEYDRAALTRAVVTPARELGLPVLDLYGPMRQADDPGHLFYRAGNDHWNEHGQALGARLTADRIQQLGWLGEESSALR